MSNVIYDDKLYNEEEKLKYIQSKGSGTQKILMRLFKITAPSEESKGKDLYAFTRTELMKVCYLFMATTPAASRSNVAYLSSYIDWALDEGRISGLNPLDSTSKAWKEQFVVRPEKRFWTEKELRTIEDKLVNAQDSVILTLLRVGVKGQESAEITNLRKKDIDFENCVLTLKDSDGSERQLKVDEYVIAQCERALRQDDYLKKNGNPSDDVRSDSAVLVENDYVVKSAMTRTINLDDADKNIVYRRLAIISKEFDEPNLTPTSIQYSGMLALAKRLLDVSGQLGEDEFNKIKEQFNVTDASLNRFKSDFLNLDELNSLYNLS